MITKPLISPTNKIDEIQPGSRNPRKRLVPAGTVDIGQIQAAKLKRRESNHFNITQMPSTHPRAVTTFTDALAEKNVMSSDAGGVRVSMTKDQISFHNQKAADYVNKHRYVNLKKEQKTYKFDPYLPFQNVKLGRDYYIVPTENPKRGDLEQTQPIALTIEKIGNPSTAKR